MLQTESLIAVSDNSGARLVKCIRALGGSNRRQAYLGDIVRVCIRSLDMRKKLLRKSIYTGLIVGTRSDTLHYTTRTARTRQCFDCHSLLVVLSVSHVAAPLSLCGLGGCRKSVLRPDGSFLRSDRNRCLIFSKEGDKFLGTRVDGPIPRELRGGANEVKYKDIISYSGATV